MTTRRIPSPEDFMRASAAGAHRDRGLSEVSEAIKRRFASQGLHEVWIFWSTEDHFVAHLFYEKDLQIKKGKASGLTAKMQQAVLEELARVGRGAVGTISIEFKIDSYETVRKTSGNYGNYLR
jgi:hypothetical protein